MKVLFSKTLIDSDVSHHEFVSVNVLIELNNMKEKKILKVYKHNYKKELYKKPRTFSLLIKYWKFANNNNVQRKQEMDEKMLLNVILKSLKLLAKKKQVIYSKS